MWLTNWLYRKQITITGQSGAGTDFQVKLVIGESSGASGVDFHVEGHSEIFPSDKNISGDLRFTSDDGETLLSFWVEKVEGTTPNRKVTLWVKVSADLGTNQNIYCYYSNSEATNVSNATNTFIFFDDFDNLDNFTTVYGSPSVASSIVTLSPQTEIRKTVSNSRPIIVDFNAKFSGIVSSGYWIALEYGFSGNKDLGAKIMSFSNDFRLATYDGVTDNYISIADTTGDYRIYTLKVASGQSLKGFDNYASVGDELTSNLHEFIDDIWLVNHQFGSSGQTLYCDWVRVRKFNVSEPSFDTSSSEETNTFQETIASYSYIRTVNRELINSSSHIIQKNIQETINSISNIRLSQEYQTINSSSHIQLPPAKEYLTSYSNIICSAKYATDVKYYNNKLYISCETEPARLVIADITSGTPSSIGYDLDDSGEDYNNPSYLTLNFALLKIYMACENGKIAKIDMTTPTTREEIDLTITEDIVTIGDTEANKITYIGTNKSTYDLYEIDEQESSHVNTDLRWIKQIYKKIKTFLSYVFKTIINTDLRYIKYINNIINTDLRYLNVAYDSLSAISLDDIHIYLDDVEMDDCDRGSADLLLNVDDLSKVTLTLARKHDQLDYKLDGTYSQITDNNIIKIRIKNKILYDTDDAELEFEISEIDCSGNEESVTITAYANEYKHNTNKIDLALPTLNTQLQLYDIISNEVKIDNPEEDTRSVITGDGGKYWTGTTWKTRIESALTFNTDALAEAYIDNKIEDNIDTLFINASPSVASREKNPKYYKGIKLDLGIQEVESQYKEDAHLGFYDIDTYVPDQNYTYFWFVSGENFVTKETFDNKYIGTSLSPASGDTYKITSMGFYRQRLFNNILTDLGFYYLGSAPYKNISCKNGKYVSWERWEDESAGMYVTRNSQYDYVTWSKKLAAVEYAKIKNINGDILPRTSAEISLTIDAFCYYNLRLLQRINITNTTQLGIYKNLNGFPISIKSISIDFGNMLVSISATNEFSQGELDVLDDTIPTEPATISSLNLKIHDKYDLNKQENIT